jgi:hypothetical protein
LTECAGEERLQQIQQEVEEAEIVRDALLQDISKLRQQQVLMEDKLKRCRDVVVHTVDCMDNLFDQKVEIAKKESAADGEICATLLRNLKAAQARVVAAGVAATELLATISDEESDQEQDSPFSCRNRFEEVNHSYAGTRMAKELSTPKVNQENMIQSHTPSTMTSSGKKILGGKAERSPQRSPLCELNTIG